MAPTPKAKQAVAAPKSKTPAKATLSAKKNPSKAAGSGGAATPKPSNGTFAAATAVARAAGVPPPPALEAFKATPEDAAERRAPSTLSLSSAEGSEEAPAKKSLSSPRKARMKGRKRSIAAKCALVLPLCLVALEFVCRTVLDVPLAKVARNMFMPPTPAPVRGKYACPHLAPDANGTTSYLGRVVTVVVTVKDACSQAPGFIEALHGQLPRDVHLIYTYPNVSTCAQVPGLDAALASGPEGQWDKVTVLPLPLSVSPMKGWVDAVEFVNTKYSLLLHNDGYALDPFFTCELVGALEARDRDGDAAAGGPFVVAAPMLYESKTDKSLAAHATQSNLRLVLDPSASTGRVVRHDHSVSRALNRGSDFGEGEQSEFLEDHGFLIESDKIWSVIDPMASYTLEYIDMIMSIRSNHWRVLFVPTARLEFRITEFSWRDIPYFMHKRSEATCHGTRDYLTSKWKANFPNTGFWTYIKYTIVEQHVYGPRELDALSWHEAAAVAFGFFQMAGYNRYEDSVGHSGVVPFTQILKSLDAGWHPAGPLQASRELERPPHGLPRGSKSAHVKKTERPIEAILGAPRAPAAVKIEADMPLEYLPFAVAELRFNDFASVPASVLPLCGLLVRHAGSAAGGGGTVGVHRAAGEVTCWVNLPTFKSNGVLVRVLDKVAALIKLPSRVTTYLEMYQGSTRTAAAHVSVVEAHFDAFAASQGNKLHACEASQPKCHVKFEFGRLDTVLQFSGKPPSAWELDRALDAALGPK